MHKGCKRRGRMGQLARQVGARQVPSWRANFDLASKKLASTQKTHIFLYLGLVLRDPCGLGNPFLPQKTGEDI